MGYYGWKPYVPVAQRRLNGLKAASKILKSGGNLSPIEPYRGAIAKTFWGKAWCDNLEAYSDYANRLPRGRTYVRNGSVIDLQIAEGQVHAKVMGSSLYAVSVKITPVPEKHWQAIGKDCSGSIDSLVELLQGKLSGAVMQRICQPQVGLFPSPNEIEMDCSCPDWAGMCKHVAAVLYGVGARLDKSPELLFKLRKVDAKDLVSQAGVGLPKQKLQPGSAATLDDAMLADIFGLEMDEVAQAPTRPVKAAPKAAAVVKAAAKAVAKKAARMLAVSAAKPKEAAPKKAVLAKKPAAKTAATAKKVAVKKVADVVQVPAAKKAPAKKVAVNKAPAKKAPAKKVAVKKAVEKKAPAKKVAVKKAVEKKAPAKKVTVKKAVAKKAVVKKVVVKAGKWPWGL